MRYSRRMGSIFSAFTWLMEQIGFAVCHQLSERSLSYGGRVLPVCARDTGLFLGFAACAVALLLAFGPRPRLYPEWPKIAVLAAFLVPTAVDALTSYAGLRESGNIMRLATGSLAGAGLAALVFPLASTAIFSPGAEPGRPAAFSEWWMAGALSAVPASVTLALAPAWSWAYWLWAPLVTACLLFTFLALNLVLAALVFERTGRNRPAAPALAALAPVAVAIEIVLSNRLHRLVLELL